MEPQSATNKRIQDLFKIGGNRDNFELFYKFLSMPGKGLSLCQVFPEERIKIFGFFNSDPLIDRIHFVNMVKPLRGPMELQKSIIDDHKKFDGRKNIFFIYNIESCIYLLDTTPKEFFRQLNLIRDFFMQFESAFVFFVTESSLKKMIQNAFDFYDWVKFTFAFEPENKDLFLQPIDAKEPEETKYSNPGQKIHYMEKSLIRVAEPGRKAVRLLELGVLYRQVNELEKAKRRVLESLELVENVEGSVAAAYRYIELGLIHQTGKEWDKALEYMKKAASIFEKNNAPKDLASAYNHLARIYIDWNEPERAMDYFLRASRIFETIKEPKALAQVYNSISRVHKDKDELDKALEFGLKALGLFESSGDHLSVAKNFNNIGLIHQARGDSDRALEYVFKALEIFEKNNDRKNIALVYSNMGRIYQSKGEKKSAAYYLERARSSVGDEFAWEGLLDRIKHKRVIPVIGQGLYRVEIESEEKNRLLYDYLAEQIAEAYGVPLHPDENHKFAKACFAFLNETGKDYEYLTEFLKERLKGIRLAPAGSLWKLARIKAFDTFLTTAYDQLLAGAVKAVRSVPLEISSYSLHEKYSYVVDNNIVKLIEESKNTFVYHLLGNMDNVQPAYTEEDILNSILGFYSDSQALYSHTYRGLFQILENSSLLFMGCGYDDWLYRLFIHTLSGKPFRSIQANNYVADDFSCNTKDPLRELPRFLKETGAEVFYSGDSGNFVDILFEKMQQRFPEEIIQPLEFPATVYISFAGRDRIAARRLASYLREDGIKVWMDESELNGGDNVYDVISKAIKNCRVFIPFLSENSRRIILESGDIPFHIREWEMALSQKSGSKAFRVIPVKIDDTKWVYDGFKDLSYLEIPLDVPGGQRGGDYNKLKNLLMIVQTEHT